jgi:hypothetical protein
MRGKRRGGDERLFLPLKYISEISGAQSLASVYKMWSYYNPNSIFGWNNS